MLVLALAQGAEQAVALGGRASGGESRAAEVRADPLVRGLMKRGSLFYSSEIKNSCTAELHLRRREHAVLAGEAAVGLHCTLLCGTNANKCTHKLRQNVRR